MAIVIKFKNGRKEVWQVEALASLISDVKHVLSVQVKEFIHEIEDHENEAASIGSVCVIQFLDNCYSAA